MDDEAGTALATFEAKWTAAHPEFGLALKFVPAEQRNAQAAFGCLGFELENAAFALRDAEPAAVKLQWWAEELMRAGNGSARHPLTQALAIYPAFARIDPSNWFAAVRGALAQRDAEPSTTLAALLEGYAVFYQPLARIGALLFPGSDADADARVGSLLRALAETATLAETLRAGRMPIPLDLLARHRLARGELTKTSAPQAAALRDWIGALAIEFAALLRARLSIVKAAAAATARVRATTVANAATPLEALNSANGRLLLAAVWVTWRAARRSPA